MKKSATIVILGVLLAGVVFVLLSRTEKKQELEVLQADELTPALQQNAGSSIFTSEPSGIEMVKIPGGEFQMGAPEDEEGRYSGEDPLHTVRVAAFHLSRYPVTNEEYGRYLKANPEASKPAQWDDPLFNRPKQPVVGVSWKEATEYCKWAKLRLPSESEWEYAARAGTTTRYYSGDKESDLDRVGWYEKNSGSKLHPVGQKDPNKYGLYDMHGNVWEWVEDDWHADYKGAPQDGSPWVETPRLPVRISRGGSWSAGSRNCRSAPRGRVPAHDRYGSLGFRVARSIP